MREYTTREIEVMANKREWERKRIANRVIRESLETARSTARVFGKMGKPEKSMREILKTISSMDMEFIKREMEKFIKENEGITKWKDPLSLCGKMGIGLWENIAITKKMDMAFFIIRMGKL